MKISIQEVKNALKNIEFRKKLPEILKPDIQKYEKNPNCTCNLDVYRNVLKHAVKELKEFYPNYQEIVDPDKEMLKLAQNNWNIINCSIDELEDKLKKLPPGRKQLAIARYQDQVTVVINELDII